MSTPQIITDTATWQSPIYDRTNLDIINRTPKGYLNVSDINRIEQNTKYLSDVLRLSLITKSWQYDNIPTSEEIERIRANAEKIIQKIIKTYKIEISKKPNYEDINKIEYALDLAHNTLENNKKLPFKLPTSTLPFF